MASAAAAGLDGALVLPRRSATAVTSRRWEVLLFLCAASAWFVARVFVAPLNHDESQYLAGALLARHAHIYRDFLSLQPPLQTWLYAPVATIAGSQVHLGMRLLTAALALLTVAIMLFGQIANGLSARTAMLTTALLAACAPFEFAASVVRNDMLPLALLTAATLLGMKALGARRGVAAAFAAGALLGLAVSAKLSYAPSLAAMALALPLLAADNRRGRLLACLAGAGIGLLPLLIAGSAAPANCFYGLITFARTATLDWYASGAGPGQLGPGAKLLGLGSAMMTSPVVVALALIATSLRHARRRPTRAEGLLIAVAAAGLVGAALPTPTQLQYLLPLLPPLFILLGLAAETRPPGTAAKAAMAVFAAASILPTLTATVAAARTGSPVVVAHRAALEAGILVRGTGRSGGVATVSPERIADSGLPVDPRFATGPFVFRSGHLLSAAAARQLHVATAATLADDFTATPPAAILVGYEERDRNRRIQVDRPLEDYALAHDYRLRRLADGIGRLYLRAAP